LLGSLGTLSYTLVLINTSISNLTTTWYINNYISCLIVVGL